MLLEFSLLITFGVFSQIENPIVSDQLGSSNAPVIQVYARLQERVGNHVRVTGLDNSLHVSKEISLPRLGVSENADVLSLNLLNHGDHFEIIRFNGIVPFTEVSAEQVRFRANEVEDKNWISVNHIEHFLIRESSESGRWDLWKSFQTSDPVHAIGWLNLAGKFFSGSPLLKSFIEENDLQNIALEADLHCRSASWISSADLAAAHGLVKSSEGYTSSTRASLLVQARSQISDLLNKASRKTNTSGIQPGSRRKMVRAIWGDPVSVEWVRFEHHMIEQWDYPDRSARLINGKVFEVKVPSGVSMNSL